jgi:hypothetical protein
MLHMMLQFTTSVHRFVVLAWTKFYNDFYAYAIKRLLQCYIWVVAMLDA